MAVSPIRADLGDALEDVLFPLKLVHICAVFACGRLGDSLEVKSGVGHCRFDLHQVKALDQGGRAQREHDDGAERRAGPAPVGRWPVLLRGVPGLQPELRKVSAQDHRDDGDGRHMEREVAQALDEQARDSKEGPADQGGFDSDRRPFQGTPAEGDGPGPGGQNQAEPDDAPSSSHSMYSFSACSKITLACTE